MESGIGPGPDRLAAVRQDEADERLWAVFSLSTGGITLLDLEGQIEAINPAMCRMLGRTAAALEGVPLSTVAHPDDAAALAARLGGAMEGRTEESPLELRFLRPEGAVTFGAALVHLVRGAGGAPRNLLLHVEDVTERRHAEDLLHENEEKFRIAFENAPTGMSIVRSNGQYLSVNAALCQMFGYSRDELLSGTLHRITHPDDVERTDRWIRKMIAGDLSEPECEKRFLHRDGHVVWGVVRARWLREADGTPRFAVVHVQDVTERKRAEEQRQRLEAQLHQAQKMEAVGKLAGGIAHDFNNLLTAIGANAAMAGTEPGVPEPVRTMLGEISQAVDSAANLTRQLLAFSRKQIVAPRVLNLNAVILQLQPLLRRLLGEDLELRPSLATGLGQVRIDPGQVEQVVVNLAVNARDAMIGGGILTLETANVRLEQDDVRSHAMAAPGDYVLLAVSDNGTGMTPEARAHLFEPFFTTKEPGRGTGLGLAVVYGVVKQNGGLIEVYTEPGHGTTFKIYWPRVFAPAEARVEPSGELRGGTEVVLLVEDDASVRAPALRMLQRLGYQALSFPGGAEALAALPDKIDLLVTDVVMPGMNGRELAERLAMRRPGLRVLYASGYSQNVIAHHGVLEPGIEFLAKPYSLESLARRVREVLDRHPVEGSSAPGQRPG
jgi:two-component system, cell cycle sensor histidine kinase and response regulator CckA